MTTEVRTGYYERELFSAAAAAAENAPQLATEIRAHTNHLAARFSAGRPMRVNDLDVRTLLGLIQQAGVRVPPARATAH
jgi:hypothetical protein